MVPKIFKIILFVNQIFSRRDSISLRSFLIKNLRIMNILIDEYLSRVMVIEIPVTSTSSPYVTRLRCRFSIIGSDIKGGLPDCLFT